MASITHHLDWIRQYLLTFGLAYFICAFPFDIYFVRKICQKNWLRSFTLSLASHLLSTVTAFYILPVVAYAISGSDRIWFYVLLFGTGTATITTLSEYTFLRLFLGKPISTRHLSFLFWNKFAIFWLSAALVLLTLKS